MMAADGYYTYTGREAVPRHITRVRIDESLTVIPANAFRGHRRNKVVDCHDRVKTVEEYAFANCPSLRKVRLRGVEEVKKCAFNRCRALEDVACDKLERIGYGAFDGCESLGSINLPSARIVELYAFNHCKALMNVKFGKELKIIGYRAFDGCTSLERITLPLKDGMITENNTFQGCKKLKHVDLVEGVGVRDTIAALLLEQWKNDMDRKMLSINQILSNTPAGNDFDVGEKARALRSCLHTCLKWGVMKKAEEEEGGDDERWY
ncbi:leucine-rich repeat domain-containing protein [Skeletonema marinoi]|uniref:Leucine-rich repeat domain-containing protein n=1 Tax=Skeletonema marinoi TaxID=267567 RepID=A0AAD9D4H2_9STRA|nr:leucine-rich repeat domain-containing protein [Skeletonema marinoi]